MVEFKTLIKKFERQGEKTGWTYIEIPETIAAQIKPGVKTGYRVKGTLDDYNIAGVSLLPMGDGNFILPLNASMRKHIGKRMGSVLLVRIEEDKIGYVLNSDLVACIADEPEAETFFMAMPLSHRNYYSKWIEAAKTEPTKIKRIALVVKTLAMGLNYAEMLHWERANRALLG